MKLKTAERTLDELTEKYENDPKGWNISIGHDDRGYFDMFISNPLEVWQVKVDSIYKPKPVGLGMKVGGRAEARGILSNNRPSFGFRPISEEVIGKILGHGEGDLNPALGGILKTEPKRLSEIRTPVVASGPINFGTRFPLSKRQIELDQTLRSNLKDLLFKKGLELEYG